MFGFFECECPFSERNGMPWESEWVKERKDLLLVFFHFFFSLLPFSDLESCVYFFSGFGKRRRKSKEEIVGLEKKLSGVLVVQLHGGVLQTVWIYMSVL